MENFLNLMEDKQVNVQVALLRSMKAVRLKADDVIQINKMESFLNSMRSDLSKKTFLREVNRFI
jgi:hypothetical protein